MGPIEDAGPLPHGFFDQPIVGYWHMGRPLCVYCAPPPDASFEPVRCWPPENTTPLELICADCGGHLGQTWKEWRTAKDQTLIARFLKNPEL